MMATLAVAAAAQAWAAPGVDPYQGDVPAAVEAYRDIPADVRARLRERMARFAYEDLPTITRDGIQGRCTYRALRDMHFGAGRVQRGPISTASWSSSMVERGPVYCESRFCIIVPTVCRNVSRIDRIEGSCEGEAPPRRRISVEIPGGLGGGWVTLLQDPPADPGTVPRLRMPALVTDRAFADATTPAEDPPTDPPNGVPPDAPLFPVVPSIPGVCAAGGCDPLAAPVPTSPAAVVTPIPEPSTWALLALGLAAIVAAKSRRTDR